MSQSFDKAMLLYGQKRYDLAIPLLQEHLADRPDDGEGLAYLALCHLKVGQVRRATELAQRGVDAEPDRAITHYASAQIWRRRRNHSKAMESIRRALGIAPDDSHYWGFRAMLHLDKKEYHKALEATESGLQLNPHDMTCLNVQAMALTGQGKPGPGREVLEAMLRESPHDSLTMASLGWNCLHQHRWKEALDYFSRSLEEDAENNFAREGMMEALRAQSPVYGFFLRYFLWLSRFSESSRWGIMITESIVQRFLREMARQHRSLRPLIGLVLRLYAIFGYLTWVARPIANLWLRLNPYGRRLLNQDEVEESTLVGGSLGLAGLSYAAWKLLHSKVYLAWYVIFLTIVIPVTSIFECPPGKPRSVMQVYTSGLFLVGVYAVYQLVQAPLTGGAAFSLYGTGLLVSRYLAMFLSRQEDVKSS